MLQDPGEEQATLSAYERRQLKLIEQHLVSEEHRPASGSGSDIGGEPDRMWVALTVTWVWLVLMCLVTGSAVLVLLALAGGAASGVHVCQQWRRSQAKDATP